MDSKPTPGQSSVLPMHASLPAGALKGPTIVVKVGPGVGVPVLSRQNASRYFSVLLLATATGEADHA